MKGFCPQASGIKVYSSEDNQNKIGSLFHSKVSSLGLKPHPSSNSSLYHLDGLSLNLKPVGINQRQLGPMCATVSVILFSVIVLTYIF